jgi:hypothetical protein
MSHYVSFARTVYEGGNNNTESTGNHVIGCTAGVAQPFLSKRLMKRHVSLLAATRCRFCDLPPGIGSLLALVQSLLNDLHLY